MATDLNLPKMLETFKVAFEALAKDKSVQQLQQVITQNKQLVHDNERLESLNQGNLDNIAKLKVQAKDTEKAAEKSRAELQSCQKRITSLSESQEKAASQVTNLAKKLKENDGVVSDLQKKANQKQDRVTHLEQELTQEKKRLEAMTSSHKKLQSSLESTTQRLGETRASLESYSSLTSDVVSMGKDAIGVALKAITSRMCTLLVTYLNTELSAEALAPIVKAVNKLSPFPMLNSNSSDAKHMRIAAAMFVAARALEEHIFQATYLLENNSFCHILSQIAEIDPVREAHVRAVLLPVEPQEGLIQKRIHLCVEEIKLFVYPMVANSQKEDFTDALQHTCEQICMHWTGLQKVEGRIVLDLEEPFDEEPCLLLSSFIREDLNKSRRPNSPNARSSNGQSTPKREPQSVDYEQIGPVVWPAFVWKVPGQETICLQNCVVLSADQVENARSEQERFQREKRLARRESTSSGKPTGNKGGKAFLSGGSEEKRNHG